MKSAQILKTKISGPGVTTGVIITFHLWPGLIELLIRSGIDYAIIDLEHLTHSNEMIADCCAIARRADFPVLIRPPEAEFSPIRLAMDLGPCGLLLPYVSSVETMATIQQAVYMAPRGRRRPGGHGNFWVSSYNYESFRSEVEDDLIILPQIENKAGLACVAAIAAHPLTTALAIGPYDLSASLGCCWNPEAPELIRALDTIRTAGEAVGKKTWIIGNPDTLIPRGFRFIGISEPILLMEGALRDLSQRVKQGSSTPSVAELLP
ncbi:MAG: aldolase/citrate lyase family protein [Verrucomicrobia bacterium]|nr:aldolase/citrate lyase family protein [Verrucomicrobiota bacterium]